ncbi:MAG TPA: hypothetical protein VE999_04455 [Gemmataceae bacterium]|nr:hypothetical protein [Gemmataceae bacterium]
MVHRTGSTGVSSKIHRTARAASLPIRGSNASLRAIGATHEAITAALEDWTQLSRVVIPPPSPGEGHWAGAPHALFRDGTFWLAYRLRRPVGRGFANVVARSDDGERFQTVAVVHREMFAAASLERPALEITHDGRWRLYVSCATPGTAHWRVDLIEVESPEGLAAGRPRTVLPGSDRMAVKDPVIHRDEFGWHLWASCHPLDDPAHTDRMTTRYAISDDGVDWRWIGTALIGREGHWDARGVRVTAVLPDPAFSLAFYDGRATAGENYEERTGLAVGHNGFEGSFAAVGETPIAQSLPPARALRYLSVVPLPDGSHRLYFEAGRPDGSHELRTMLVQGKTSDRDQAAGK